MAVGRWLRDGHWGSRRQEFRGNSHRSFRVVNGPLADYPRILRRLAGLSRTPNSSLERRQRNDVLRSARGPFRCNEILQGGHRHIDGGNLDDGGVLAEAGIARWEPVRNETQMEVHVLCFKVISWT